MIQIVDTTLRDGSQTEGISFSVDDKIQIVHQLDDLGIKWIEAGSPAANPSDNVFFKTIDPASLKNASLVAFGPTCKPGIAPEDDTALRILSDCSAEIKTIFGKSSLFHVTNVLHCSEKENLRMIRDSIHWLVENGNTVWFDAEHFFDGYAENPAYALETVSTAMEAGASCIVLCDTNGGSFPEQISSAVTAVKKTCSILLGFHGHNDIGLAVANTLAALEAGCSLLQGTIGGIGERCGNTDLCTLIPLLSLKKHIRCIQSESLSNLTHISRVISEIMNVVPNSNAPFVGHSAFAHKAGIHIDAIIKDPSAYESVNPESVGNQRRFLLSNQSGRTGIYARLNKLLPDLDRNSPEIETIMNRLKEKESRGYTYENADGSFDLLALDTIGRRPHYFEVVDYHVLSSRNISTSDKSSLSAQAYLKIRVDGKEGINAAEGNGPVNALDVALKKTLSLFYPCISRVTLRDFKVRVLNSAGTASKVRVSIESTDGVHIWNTVGVSEDIIQACLKALTDSVDYMLTKYAD